MVHIHCAFLIETLVYAYVVEVAMALVPIICGKTIHRGIRDYGLRLSKKLLFQGVSLSIVIGVGLGFISAPASLTVSRIVLLGLAAPMCEEFFFRGFFQTNLMEKVRGGKKFLKFHLSYGLILTALIFGSLHLLDIFLFDLSLTNAIFNAAFATLFGLLLGYAYQETRSILGPVLMHCCLNVLPLVLPLIR